MNQSILRTIIFYALMIAVVATVVDYATHEQKTTAVSIGYSDFTGKINAVRSKTGRS